MKKLLIFLLLVPSICFSKMIPLGSYMDKIVNYDDNALFYIYTRCSGINFKVSDLSKNMPDLLQETNKRFENFFILAIESRARILPNETLDNHKKITGKTITEIIDQYTIISNDYYVKNGDYFDDDMLNDVKLCTQISEMT